MAAPAVDFSPILKSFMPLFILVLIVTGVLNFLTPPRRKRRGSQYSTRTPRRRYSWPTSRSERDWHSEERQSQTHTSSLSSPTALSVLLARPAPVDIPSPLSWSLENLQRLEWKRMEILTAQFFKAIGFDARMTRVGADGGVDVELRQLGQDKPVGYAQCKAWTTYKVGVKPIRELYGVMAAEHVQHGVFVTTSIFTEEACEFARGKDLELVDGATLIGFIKRLPPDQQQELLKTAFAGDFSTPTCPNCDIKMVSRTAHKGKDVGSTFWGCRNYPRCKQTFKMRD
jgi:hypothetical protein